MQDMLRVKRHAVLDTCAISVGIKSIRDVVGHKSVRSNIRHKCVRSRCDINRVFG